MSASANSGVAILVVILLIWRGVRGWDRWLHLVEVFVLGGPLGVLGGIAKGSLLLAVGYGAAVGVPFTITYWLFGERDTRTPFGKTTQSSHGEGTRTVTKGKQMNVVSLTFLALAIPAGVAVAFLHGTAQIAVAAVLVALALACVLVLGALKGK